MLVLATLAFRGRRREVLALLHFLVGNINYKPRSPVLKALLPNLLHQTLDILNSS
jgi:hypothetical protein